jgi:N-acetylglucosamine-6-sulfatase
VRHQARAAAALVLTAIVAAVVSVGASSGSSSTAPARPNFLLILVDDQAMNTFTPQLMPDTYRWIVRPGTKFADGLAAPPLCCPDRAGILTGQYPHNNGVFSNDPGYPALAGKHNTLPRWLDRAGYQTGFIGKWLNNEGTSSASPNPAPGWDYWFAFLNPVGYYRYFMSENGRREWFGSTRASYSTDVLTRHAKRFVASTARTKPWFLWLAYNAPHDTQPILGSCGHTSAMPPTQGTFLRHGQVPLPIPPSYNERDVSDKPSFVAGLPSIGATVRGHIQTRYDCAVATMWEVDRQIGRLMRWLKERGALSNTIVLYMSDNGFYFGEHRIARGKSLPYEPGLRVPYAIRVPAADEGSSPPPRVSSDVVTNEDVAPTILDYAGGVRPCARRHLCRTLDGRSLRPLLGGPGSFPRNRAALAEINAPAAGAQYAAVRTRDYIYTEYDDGEKELYDLRRDPFEKQNVVSLPSYAPTELDLAKKLRQLRLCSGTHGGRPCL